VLDNGPRGIIEVLPKKLEAAACLEDSPSSHLLDRRTGWKVVRERLREYARERNPYGA
jgi:hypothetical protein